MSSVSLPALFPCGRWPSPITAGLVAQTAPAVNFLSVENDCLYWVESRPWDAGRNVIMCRNANGEVMDLLPPPFSHHSRVHEYGGRAYVVNRGVLYFIHALDQRLYALCLSADATPRALTPSSNWRFADLIVDDHRHRIIAVGECHPENGEPANMLVSLQMDPIHDAENTPQPIIHQADFYAYPRLSPDGKTLCWIQWCHPQMPWDGTELWLGTMAPDGTLMHSHQVAGDHQEAIMQPIFSPDGDLYFVSDHSNWWNLYCITSPNSSNSAAAAPILKRSAEFAAPLWQLGVTYFDFIDAQTVGCLFSAEGVWSAAIFDIESETLNIAKTPYSHFHSACCFHGNLVCVAANAQEAQCIIRFDKTDDSGHLNQYTSLYTPENASDTRTVSPPSITKEDLSFPESVIFPSADGTFAQGFFYPPTNADYHVRENELPPLLVMCHGGPTSSTSSQLSLKIQYWTSRGFAVFDLNYRGSSGFGRGFRQALNHNWGMADVEDTRYAVNHLVAEGWVDPQRCAIRGGSAGGYTVLATLTFTQTFKAGASLYGIGDLETLARDTHKFESRYLDGLIGPYPQCRERYVQRSPVHHADQLECPVIFFQGLKDRVVPPNQAQMMVHALRQKGIRAEHITYPEEGHGFKDASVIVHALETELAFYQDVFKL